MFNQNGVILQFSFRPRDRRFGPNAPRRIAASVRGRKIGTGDWSVMNSEKGGFWRNAVNDWCRLGESNPRPRDYETLALPLS